jgi:hypothetical protein
MEKNIKVAELDFKEIKSSIINYMKNHPTNKTFNSYDFEGSGLNSLIDILAYNTHHHAYYLNMIASEMFLDTAQIRENVISKCKLLGYIPKSNTCAKVSVNLIAIVEIRSDSETLPTRFLPITRSAKFKLNRKDGVPWSFYPEKEGYAVRTHSNIIGGVEGRKYDVFRLDDFILLQGNIIEEYFYYDESDLNQKFMLTNSGIDTDTIRVFVTYSDMESDNISEYYLERDNMKLDKDSLVFFLQESINEQYEIYFGDGVFGRKLSSNDLIKVEYLDCVGSAANGVGQGIIFDNDIDSPLYNIVDTSFLGIDEPSILINSKTFGGGDRETVEQIRHAAPRAFSSQKRAVTLEDYKIIIKEVYPLVESLNVWGGEDNIPPKYGSIFISIRPKFGDYISEVERSNIEYDLKRNHSMLGISPIIVSPKYIKLGIKIMIKYNSDQTTRSSDDIKNMVYDEVVRFSKEDLNSFGDYFRYSKFLAMIDNTHHSIENNLTDVVLRVNEDIPGHGKPYTYIFNFSNKIKKGTVRSSEFRIPDSEFLWHFVDDKDHDGHLLFHRKGEIEGEFIVNTYLKGICDYNKGLVRIDNVIILESDYYTDISVTCSLSSDDIYPRGNQILYIDQTNISIDIMDNDLFYNSENSSVRSVNII